MHVDRDLLDRFHRILVREIRKSNPEYFEAPFTVAEIYQHLVPYRSHRDELGIDANGQYEAALMRLLAGEGDYLILESEPALRKIRAEMENPAPNTGLFREFAAAEVRLNPDRVVGEHLLEEEGGAEPSAAKPAETEDAQVSLEVGDPPAQRVEAAGAGEGLGTAVEQEGGRSPRSGAGMPASQGNGEIPAVAFGSPTLDDLPAECPDCTGGLPSREGLRFCPHCGVNVHIVPCPECDADLERAWNFCIYCGAAAGG